MSLEMFADKHHQFNTSSGLLVFLDYSFFWPKETEKGKFCQRSETAEGITSSVIQWQKLPLFLEKLRDVLGINGSFNMKYCLRNCRGSVESFESACVVASVRGYEIFGYHSADVEIFGLPGCTAV